MEAGMITTVLLVACATICIGVGIFYFFINNTKNKGRICILLLGIGGSGHWVQHCMEIVRMTDWHRISFA